MYLYKKWTHDLSPQSNTFMQQWATEQQCTLTKQRNYQSK